MQEEDAVRGFSVFLLAVVAVLLMSTNVRAAGNGYMQVKCESGVTVSLNGQIRGVATKQLGGFIFQDLAPGEYRVTITKEDHEPQEQRVRVTEGQVALCTFGALVRMGGGSRFAPCQSSVRSTALPWASTRARLNPCGSPRGSQLADTRSRSLQWTGG
jgi:hypothetical protein